MSNRSWYSERGVEERPSKVPGHVDLYRCGKFIATVKLTTKEESA